MDFAFFGERPAGVRAQGRLCEYASERLPEKGMSRA